MISVIITAGGSSSRFKNGNKLLYEINAKPLIYHTVSIFNALDYTDEIILPANKEIIEKLEFIFKKFDKVRIIEGGNSRQESVYRGLENCKNCKYVIIHDGARPFINEKIIDNCLEKAKIYGAAIVGVKTTDTIKVVDDEGKVISTPQRNTLWNAQTPQIFSYSKIFELHKKYRGKNFTDDSLLFEQEGLPVMIQEGEYSNIKITTIYDLQNCKQY